MNKELQEAVNRWNEARKALVLVQQRPLKMPRLMGVGVSEYVEALQQRYQALQTAYDALMALNTALWAVAYQKGITEEVIARLTHD